MPKKLRTVVVDDEPLALKLMLSKLSKIPEIEIVATCKNGREAIDAVMEKAPDLMFLDIQMPGLTGLEVVKQLQNDVQPLIVFATAFEQYALDAFDAHAVDYVVKPIDDERIKVSVDRALQRHLIQQQIKTKQQVIGAIESISEQKTVAWSTSNDNQAPKENKKIVIKDRDEIHIISQTDIQWIDAAGDYICVHAKGETHVKRSTLKEMLNELDENMFKRIHRSTIVNLSYIRKVIPHTKGEYFLMLGEFDKVKVSRNYKDVIKSYLSAT
jgi:two-component system LytT family response regulator